MLDDILYFGLLVADFFGVIWDLIVGIWRNKIARTVLIIGLMVICFIAYGKLKAKELKTQPANTTKQALLVRESMQVNRLENLHMSGKE